MYYLVIECVFFDLWFLDSVLVVVDLTASRWWWLYAGEVARPHWGLGSALPHLREVHQVVSHPPGGE